MIAKPLRAFPGIAASFATQASSQPSQTAAYTRHGVPRPRSVPQLVRGPFALPPRTAGERATRAVRLLFRACQYDTWNAPCFRQNRPLFTPKSVLKTKLITLASTTTTTKTTGTSTEFEAARRQASCASANRFMNERRADACRRRRLRFRRSTRAVQADRPQAARKPSMRRCARIVTRYSRYPGSSESELYIAVRKSIHQ